MTRAFLMSRDKCVRRLTWQRCSPVTLVVVALLVCFSTCSAASVLDAFQPEDGACGDLGPWMEDICHTDAHGKENEHCTPCLVGPEWDALRTELGTELIKGYRSSVPTLKYSDWLSQTMATSAFRVLLKELLGYDTVRMVTTSGLFTLEEAASESCQSIHLEAWHFDQAAEQELVQRDKAVMVEFMGTIGQEGIYVPQYVPFAAALYAGLTAADGDAAELMSNYPADGSVFHVDRLLEYFPDGEPFGCDAAGFLWKNSSCAAGRWYPKNCGSTYPSPTCRELYIASNSWSRGWFEASIQNLGLNFSVVYTSNNGVRDTVKEMHQEGRWGAYYWWKPDPLLVKYPSRALILPEFSQACGDTFNYDPNLSGVDCAREMTPLRKVMNSQQAADEPDIHHLWKKWFLSGTEMDNMLSFHEEGGGSISSPDEAACRWLKSEGGFNTWRHWVQLSDPCQGRATPHTWDQATNTCVPSELPSTQSASEKESGHNPMPFWVYIVLVCSIMFSAAALVFNLKRWQKVDTSRSPPARGAQVTIVITDIESSTTLWDKLPDEVSAGIALHHRCLRDALAQFNGYEVATEGDSFKCAFHHPEDAVCWAVHTQLELLVAPWHPELEDPTKYYPGEASHCADMEKLPRGVEDDPLPICFLADIIKSQIKLTGNSSGDASHHNTQHAVATQYSKSMSEKWPLGTVSNFSTQATVPAFRGLRVRVGMHTGIADVVGVHEVTKRVTYGGKVVAKAKEVSDTPCGGQIIMSGETLAAITSVQQLMCRLADQFSVWSSGLDTDIHESAASFLHCGSHVLKHVAPAPTEPEQQLAKWTSRGSLSMVSSFRIPSFSRSTNSGSWGKGRRAREAEDRAGDTPEKQVDELVMVVPWPLRARISCYPPLKTTEVVTPAYFDAPGDTDQTTIMFTFIHGWAALQEAFGAALDPVRRQYALLIRHCLQQYNGYEVEGENDSFVCAFYNANDAVECGISLQLAVRKARWDMPVSLTHKTTVRLGSKLRVKVGMCTGKPAKVLPCLRTGRRSFFGSVMNHAARITAKARGGQVLLHQDSFSNLDRDRLRSSIVLEAAGEMSFKGVTRKIAVFGASDTAMKAAPLDIAKEALSPMDSSRTCGSAMSFSCESDQTSYEQDLGFTASGEQVAEHTSIDMGEEYPVIGASSS